LNKIVSIKNINAIFLATVLIAGTITLSFPSFLTNVQAQQEYNGMDNWYNSYEPKPYYPDNTYNSYGPSNERDNYEKPTSYSNENNYYEPREYPSYQKN